MPLAAAAALAAGLVLALADTPMDVRGDWPSVGRVGAASYPQTYHITNEDFTTGAFSGTDVGGGLTFAVTGRVSGNRVTMTVTAAVISYTSRSVGTIVVTDSGRSMAGTFTDSNGASGTYTAESGPAPGAVVTVSSVASALNPPGAAFKNPALIAVNIAVTAVVILFITFPSALFNQTLTANYEEIRAVTRRFDLFRHLARRAAGAVMSGGRRAETITFGVVAVVGAVLNGLLDPTFGFTSKSALTLTGFLLSLCFGAAVSAAVAGLYRRGRGDSTEWHLHALPLGLGIAAVCVLVSRLTGFHPGYFYGLVCGVAFATHLGKRETGHVTALGATATMAVAVLAWFGWAVVNPLAGARDAFTPLVVIDDFLAALFVGGLVGNVVGLLPFKSLAGGNLIQWNRIAWAAIFGVAVFGMVQVLLHPEQGNVHPSSAPVVTAILLFVGFAGGSLAFNRYFTWQGRPTRLRPAAVAPVAATVAVAAAPAEEESGPLSATPK